MLCRAAPLAPLSSPICMRALEAARASRPVLCGAPEQNGPLFCLRPGPQHALPLPPAAFWRARLRRGHCECRLHGHAANSLGAAPRGGRQETPPVGPRAHSTCVAAGEPHLAPCLGRHCCRTSVLSLTRPLTYTSVRPGCCACMLAVPRRAALPPLHCAARGRLAFLRQAGGRARGGRGLSGWQGAGLGDWAGSQCVTDGVQVSGEDNVR